MKNLPLHLEDETNNAIVDVKSLLNQEEKLLLKKLKELEKQWKTHGKDLWIFAADGGLNVMLQGGTKRNPNKQMINEGVNPDNLLLKINITADGGDW